MVNRLGSKPMAMAEVCKRATNKEKATIFLALAYVRKTLSPFENLEKRQDITEVKKNVPVGQVRYSRCKKPLPTNKTVVHSLSELWRKVLIALIYKLL